MNQTIYAITLRHYPDIEKTYSFFRERWGFCNLARELYFAEPGDVLKFIHEFIYKNGIDWSGEEGAKKRADEAVALMVEHKVLEDLNSKYMVYPVPGGDMEIKAIKVNDLGMVLESPLMRRGKL